MPKHTKGPWNANEPGSYGDFDGRSIVIDADDKRIIVVQGKDAEARSNARLVIMGPEMLKALRYCRRFMTPAGSDTDYIDEIIGRAQEPLTFPPNP